ncbi:MAG: SNF2-related protein [Spirosomataceae bacterium]
MNVSATEPFKMIYSVLNHEYLGYLFEAFVVQLTPKGELSYLYQTVSTKNVAEFKHGLHDTDLQLVKLIDAMQQDVVLKKFNPKKWKPLDFFLKIYDPQKGDKTLQEAIGGYLENIKSQILPLLLDEKRLFIMGGDGNPTWQEIQVLPSKATVLFHFMRNADNTHYFPTIKYEGEKVEFQYKNALILSDEPAWLVCNGKLYHFEKDVDGKKLRPFLNKKFIVIPKNIEEDYYRKFVTSVITQFDVYAKGFDIKSEHYPCVPLLSISETKVNKPVLQSLFDKPAETDPTTEEDVQALLNLSFQYGTYTFRFDSFAAPANVSMEKRGEDYVFHKIKRDLAKEKEKILLLRDLGVDLRSGRLVMGKMETFDWVQQNYLQLQEAGIRLSQQVTDGKRYFLGYSSLNVSIHEGNDWFDIYAVVRFGEFEIPFLQLKDLILRKRREFTLPNGEIAVIPEAWFTHYAELFAFSEHHEQDENCLKLKKYHLALVQELGQENLASVVMTRKLEKLRDFQEIEDAMLPSGFNGMLRPYQKAGYNWLQFLNRYSFGGCLADDMGLGKTVQTLALLQAQKEQGLREPSLLVMPTSLIYNWLLEAEKFTPQLRVLVYTGSYRDKNTELFDQYDLILTSYGIVRIDVDLLKYYRFNYIILDESQAIKNPSSNIAKAVMQLNARHRLILTGTPLENSTMDLWSQLNFVNEGLLGSQSFFRNEFLVPIEKRNDEKKTQRLYNLVKPFMLRRHKSQVATELPPKIENVQYCDMTEEQEREYEEAKSHYRNLILKSIEDEGIAKSQWMVLQGLTKLRQIANHPRLVDGDYDGASGKLTDVLWKMESVIRGGHKILIFSQFVKHLDVFRQHLDAEQIRYAYLDGNTQDRQGQVELFQKDESVKIFLISLKAGGLGLNLTAAEYVFILDPWWNPAIESQAVDRAHRIGQEKTVFTYKFITKNSVEEKILALQKNKLRLANELITTEETFVKSLSKEDVLALLE